MALKDQPSRKPSDKASEQEDQKNRSSVSPAVDEKTKELWKIADQKLAAAQKAEQEEISQASDTLRTEGQRTKADKGSQDSSSQKQQKTKLYTGEELLGSAIFEHGQALMAEEAKKVVQARLAEAEEARRDEIEGDDDIQPDEELERKWKEHEEKLKRKRKK